jgi:DNA-binding transcriptional LysR family regulator
VVTAEELAAETMIVRRHCEALPLVSRHFTERGVRPFMAARSTNDAAVLSYVRAGLGITVMPHSFITEGIAMPRLSGFDLRRSIGFSESADGKRTHSSMGYAAMVQWAAGLATEAAARQG